MSKTTKGDPGWPSQQHCLGSLNLLDGLHSSRRGFQVWKEPKDESGLGFSKRLKCYKRRMKAHEEVVDHISFSELAKATPFLFIV